MAVANVKCYFCGQTFDRNKEPFVKVNARRYAHRKCAEQQDERVLQQIEDREQFYEIVKKIYGSKYNYIMINSQAEEYIKQYNYTWSGMTGCLYWFYILNHGSLEEGHGGIGIIPYIYDNVKDFFKTQYETQEKNKKVTNLRIPVEFNIQSPRPWNRPPHLIDLGDDEDE